MSNVRIGRNDPCPCGSGKKYKRCHWGQYQEPPPATQPLPAAAAPAIESSAASAPARLSFAALRRQLPALAKWFPDLSRAERSKLAHMIEVAADYEVHQKEIDAAHEALEPYRAKFEAWLQDGTALFEWTHRLFGEETFAALRFGVADIQRAFAAVGYPGLPGDDDTVETVRQAILFLADEEHRQNFVVRLLRLLPEYVAAGRHLDACLVESCAQQTGEDDEESNPFLWEMFAPGYREWEAQRRDQEGSLLRQMGLDLEQLRGLSPDELAQRIQQLTSDPALLKQIEDYVAANPEVHAALEAQCASTDTLSIVLLDRADAAPLLPGQSETAPWLEQLQQRFLADESLTGVLDRGEAPTDRAVNVFGDLLWSVAAEMAAAVFTPARVAQLKTQLREFAAQHRAAGDHGGADQAEAALLVLGRESSTRDSHFLNSICYTAMREAVRALAQAGGSDPAT